MILGACNPPFAYQALQAEINIGTMLPCNVAVMEKEDGKIRVSAIDPLASMMAVDNQDINAIAKNIQTKLIKVMSRL